MAAHVFTSILTLALAVASFANLEPATGDDAAELREGMAQGIINNIELRKMLIGKFMSGLEGPVDHDGSMVQFRYIIKIQTDKFGKDSAEAAQATKEANDHLELLLVNEQKTFDEFMKDPAGVQKKYGDNKDGLNVLMQNIKIKELLAKQSAAAGKNADAAERYKEIADAMVERYGASSPEHVSAIEQYKESLSTKEL